MNFYDDFVDFDGLVKKIREANADFSRSKSFQSYRDRFLKDFSFKNDSKNAESSEIKINNIEVYRVKPYLNIVINILDKKELEEKVMKKSELQIQERIFRCLLCEEEKMLFVLNEASKLIDIDIVFIRKSRLNALDNLIPYFKSKFSRNLLINIKSLKNPPANIAKTLNLFFTVFSNDYKNLIKTEQLNSLEYVPHEAWKPYLRILNDKELQNLVINFKYKNDIGDELKKELKSYLRQVDLNFLHIILNEGYDLIQPNKTYCDLMDQRILNKDEIPGLNPYRIIGRFMNLDLEEYNLLNKTKTKDKQLTFEKSLKAYKECGMLMILILSIVEYSQSLDEIDTLRKRQNKLASLIEKQKNRMKYLIENKKVILNEQIKRPYETLGEEVFYENKEKDLEYNFKKRYFDHILVYQSNK